MLNRNSYSSSAYRITEYGLRLQAAHQEMLSNYKFSHFVTLNFHRQCSDDAANKLLAQWTRNLESRLFRSAALKLMCTPDRFFFVAYREFTRKEEPHFHLLLNINDQRVQWFENTTSKFWKKLVPSGTADVQRIGTSTDDQKFVARYATKNAARSFSSASFMLSTMLS